MIHCIILISVLLFVGFLFIKSLNYVSTIFVNNIQKVSTLEEDSNELIKLGLVEFHTDKNIELIKDFYNTVDDLKNSSSIIDIWLLDIQTVLKKHGYEMVIYKKN